MDGLNSWLQQATRRLSRDSAAQVRTEIQEHYEAARDVSMGGGATAEQAERAALSALGDPKDANREYRQVLLTAREAKMLGEGNWEARAVCSRAWLKWLFLALPLAVLCAGALTKTWGLVAGGVALGVFCITPFLPVYTPARARTLRWAKWAVLLGMLALNLNLSWLLFSCLCPLITLEWTRMSIRRKLPVARWPKQLYL